MSKQLRLVFLLPLLWMFAGNGSTGQERPASHTTAAPSGGAITAADSARAIRKLSDDLQRLVALPSEVKSGNVGVTAISLRNGKPLFALNSTKPLTPASTTKLVTTYSALLLFGPDYGIPTIALAEHQPKKGVVSGDLFIKGHGDPLLSINDIDLLVDKIKAAGVTRIEGDIVGDATYFDQTYDRKEYSGDADYVVDLPPICGLAIESNMVTVVVSSSRTPGQLCTVQTFPPSSGFTIINSAKSSGGAAKTSTTSTKSSKKKTTKAAPAKSSKKKTTKAAPAKSSSKKKKRSALDGGHADPATIPQIVHGFYGDEEYTIDRSEKGGSGGISISITTEDDGRQVVHVSGTMGVNKTVSKRYEIKNPPLIVAGMFYDRLRTRGITITGGIRTGATTAEAKSLGEFRRPLLQVLEPLMKNSDNYYAEYVFKMIGGATAKDPAGKTADCSRASIIQCMENSSVPFGSCVLNDGSGLSRRNVISSDALAATLQAAYHNKKLYNALYSVMSIAGVDGTLRKRMKGTRAEGNVHGKTGTLRNVSALTGYVTTADGDMVAFSALMNGGSIGAYKGVQDKIAERLADFSYKEGLSPEGK